MTISITQLNGKSAGADELSRLAFAGYAHFTAMQVRDRGVRGLDLHFDRLKVASDTLFGTHLPDVQLRQYFRTALDSAPPDVSLACYISSRPGEFEVGGAAPQLDVLIKITEPAAPPIGPLALDVVEHERHLPHVKHVGEVSKTLLIREANARGFDDAAFVDRSGRLSEATIWNLGFWDGETAIWPDAPMLTGVTMQILQRQLRARGVAQRSRHIQLADVDHRSAAVVMNSWSPGIPISRIGERRLGHGAEFAKLLRAAYLDEPVELLS